MTGCVCEEIDANKSRTKSGLGSGRRRSFGRRMSSYANDIGSPEVEIAGEASAGGFFQDAKSRHADLKAMLDSSKENLKMEAMRRIIVMVAKGRDASDLFPAVVKNVAARNLELRKLVYVYLERYAEEQQDLALLSISTFQRALKDPNQLIRASALRVLSSIRVPMIAPILMLALKESMRDMSPYVRKVAAHAIPKLFALEPELKDDLIGIIDHLLADKATLVAGSAVYAYQELCPDRTDLIHRHFRKLAQLLVDVDEWGQVIIINTLTRYARTQFTDPNQGEPGEEKPVKFYSSSEEEDEQSGETEQSESSESGEEKEKPYVMDPDLRMLLRNTKPLLQSRNSAVVLAVAQLYYHLAPAKEVGVIARALIRLLRSHREVQAVVLANIATISAQRPVRLYAISKVSAVQRLLRPPTFPDPARSLGVASAPLALPPSGRKEIDSVAQIAALRGDRDGGTTEAESLSFSILFQVFYILFWVLRVVRPFPKAPHSTLPPTWFVPK